MPQVPTVDGTSVSLNAAPDAYQRAPQMLGAAGESKARQLGQVAQVGQQLTAELQKQQNRDDIDAVFRAETGLKDEYLKFERDELGKLGVNAKGAAERSQAWWDEAQKKYADGLSERQLHAFRRSATTLRQASSSTLSRHEQNQLNESLKQSAQARVGTAIDMAIGDPVPERLAAARKEITEAVGIASKLAGYAPEVTQAKLSEALTLMHRGVVMRLVDNDPDAAKAYYYGNKKEIAGDTRAAIEKTLERGGRLQKAQEAADDIMVKFPDLNAAMSHIEKTYQGEDEQAIKAEVRDRWTTSKTAKNQMSQTAYETAMLATVQGRKVPAEVWSQMDDGHKAAIIEKREAEAKARMAAAEGKAIKTDYSLYTQLRRMAIDEPEKFVGYDVGRHVDKIGGAQLEQLLDLQQGIKKADGKLPKEVRTVESQIRSTMRGLNIGTGKQFEAQRGMLEDAIRTAIDDETKIKGKDLSADERQKIIDRQTLEVLVDKPWYTGGDVKKRAYELKPDEYAKAKIVVPDDDRKLIRDALKAKNKPVTDDAILDMYKKHKGLQ